MTANEIRELLNREPFEPFRFHLTSGHSYEVRDPNSVAVGARRVFIAIPTSDIFVFFPYKHIAAIEKISNGHRTHRKRRS